MLFAVFADYSVHKYCWVERHNQRCRLCHWQLQVRRLFHWRHLKALEIAMLRVPARSYIPI